MALCIHKVTKTNELFIALSNSLAYWLHHQASDNFNQLLKNSPEDPSFHVYCLYPREVGI